MVLHQRLYDTNTGLHPRLGQQHHVAPAVQRSRKEFLPTRSLKKLVHCASFRSLHFPPRASWLRGIDRHRWEVAIAIMMKTCAAEVVTRADQRSYAIPCQDQFFAVPTLLVRSRTIFRRAPRGSVVAMIGTHVVRSEANR